ncbi:hypothetical protein VTK56DRAFT_3471 [Thermocarpiscus australiensis]
MDPVSLVSLGLQVCGGIATYLEGLDCHERHILTLRQEKEQLEKALQVIQTSLSYLQPAHPELTDRARACLNSCVKELNALDKEARKFAARGNHTAGLGAKIRVHGKKLLYPFNRPRLKALEERVRNTNGTLQLLLNTLALTVSQSGTERLDSTVSTLESTSQSVSTGLVSVQCEMTALSSGMSRGFQEQGARLSDLQSLLRQVVLALHGPAAAVSSREMLVTPGVAAGRPIRTPEALRDMCDVVGPQTRPRSSMVATPGRRDPAEFFNYRASSPSSFGGSIFACTCRPRQLVRRRNLLRGSLAVVDTTVQEHLPGCPVSELLAPGGAHQRKVGLRLTGLGRLLTSAVIELSFAVRAGAGGWSISPNLTYYPTVDSSTAPAFRILALLRNKLRFMPTPTSPKEAREILSQWERLVALASAKLVQLFRDGKASPLAVDLGNRNLIHHMVHCIHHSRSNAFAKPLLEVLRYLIMCKVPATDYDVYGW